MIRPFARLAWMLISWMPIVALLLAAPAHADDVVYPPGSRIGLVPSAGLHISTSFPGFEDPDNNGAVLLGTLPAEAYLVFEKSDPTETMKKLGRHPRQARDAVATHRQGHAAGEPQGRPS